MAKETESKTNAQPKRLARAKVRRPETPEEVEKRKLDRKKAIRNVAVSAFAILLVLSMMIPSLASIVSGARNAKAVSEAQNAISGGEVTAEQIDAIYGSGIDELEKTLTESPNDLDTLLQLGNQYLSWGYAAGAYISDDTAAEHSTELFTKAQEYYDRYLAIEDNVEVKVNRALCDLYAGNISEAQTGLEAVVADNPESASAWANLGMIYELTNPDAAALAYERAIAADPDDEAGAKSYAQARLDALNSVEEVPEATDEDADAEATDDAEVTEEAEAETTDTDAESTGTSN